ncbi:50S ribosome-binding protein YggL [Candidatus Laterigemmans baculatus]|uniref:50S ribosome-binding protein YggL n=1 Tax=Candidatus Laterigemmans baculatus TaxID=2770505 RepID=UPI0013DB8D16|nr:50S ribosome-binding protein YggL [Candidatus Laterigemmans baculatus]
MRKKRRLGEFTDWCFELDATFDPPLTERQLDVLCEQLIDAVETAGLQFGGGGDGGSYSVIVQFGDRQPNEDDRRQFEAWFRRLPQLASCRTGPLRDANYGWSS